MLFGQVAVARLVFLVLHEGAHACAALMLGYREYRISIFTWQPLTRVHDIEPHHRDIVRHAGWLASVFVALICAWGSDEVDNAVAWLTAVESIQSDLLRIVQPGANGSVSGDDSSFFCGNFGLLLLHEANKHMVKPLIRKMIRVSMMRGAQSAGVVTYTPPSSRRVGGIGRRHRVLNGKRTDLADMLLAKARRQLDPANIQSTKPQLFQGHTRFATSSVSDLAGAHPHQWSKPSHQVHWALVPDGTTGNLVIRGCPAHVEAYITHNGVRWHVLLYITKQPNWLDHFPMSTQC